MLLSITYFKPFLKIDKRKKNHPNLTIVTLPDLLPGLLTVFLSGVFFLYISTFYRTMIVREYAVG